MSVRHILFAALLLLSGVATAKRTGSAMGLVVMLQSGRPRMAIQNASRHLESQPNDVEVLTALGIGEARAGYFADALGTLSLCAGAELYNDLGLEAHANALRAFGRGDEAFALRLQRRVAPMAEMQEQRLWLHAADDLLSAGDALGALDANLVGMAAYPESALLLAQHAEIMIALGDEDEADFWLWRADQQGRTQRWLIVESARRQSLGDVTGAYAIADRAIAVRQPTARLAAARADALRRIGEPDTARHYLSFGSWSLTEDPHILVARLAILRDLGEAEAEAQIASRLAALYPDNAMVRAALRASLGQ